MIFRYPSYYEKFQCIAGQCEDTCCAGWEIDIDDASYERYMKVTGEFGKRLRENIREYEPEREDVYEEHGFVLKKHRRCAFLMEDNLCELYRELGEDALCEVCTDTPRNYFEYGGERELSLSASCPEAARLIYAENQNATFVEKEIEGELDFVETKEEQELAHQIRCARDREIVILQNRDVMPEQRAVEFMQYAVEVQESLNQTSLSLSEGTMTVYQLFLKRMVSLTGLESISKEWEDYLILLRDTFVENRDGEDLYLEAQRGLREVIQRENREHEYEHLLVYYAFLCLPRSVDDYDFIGKAKLTVMSFLVIRDISAAFLYKNKYFTEKNWMDLARIYAKEIEHSQNNLEYLADEFLFEDAYSIGNLKRAILLQE